MKTYLCAIKNLGTGQFSPPLLFPSIEVAVSTFINEVTAQNSELWEIREKLEVYCLGRYEVTSGKIQPYLFKKQLQILPETTTWFDLKTRNTAKEQN